MRLLALVIPLLMLTGCMTEATQERFKAEGERADNCRARVTAAKIEIQKYKAQQLRDQPRVKFTNENTALLHGAIKIIGDTQVALIQAAFNRGSDDMASCDDVIVAMVKADAAKVAGLNNTGGTAVRWVAGLVGLGIISDNWGPSNYGGTTGDTWNVEGSRVVNKSGNYGGNASSSGTGLGIGQTYNDGLGQMQGGFQPRQIDNVEATSVSNSGEQLPTNSNNAETPEQLPAEE